MRRRLFGFMLAAMMIAGCSKQSDTIPEATIISRESTEASSEEMTSETDKGTEKDTSEPLESTDVTEEITETNTPQTVNEESMTEEPSEETSTEEASSEEATMEASTEESLAEADVVMTEPEQSAVKVSMTEPILPAETTVQQAQPSTQPPTQPPTQPSIETSEFIVTPTVPETTTAPMAQTEPETTKVPEPTTEETTTVAVTTEPETTTPTPPTEPQKVYHDDYEKAKSGVDMINEYRRAAGVSEVKWSDALYAAALIRAKQMYDSRSIAHLGDMGGEIHAMATSPGQAVAGWVASPGHYEYMINARYKYCAMAFYDNYCLAMFGPYPILFNTFYFDLIIPESEGRFDGNTTLGDYEKTYYPVDYGVLCAVDDNTLYGAKIDDTGHYITSILDENEEKVMLTDEQLLDIINRYL